VRRFHISMDGSMTRLCLPEHGLMAADLPQPPTGPRRITNYGPQGRATPSPGVSYVSLLVVLPSARKVTLAPRHGPPHREPPFSVPTTVGIFPRPGKRGRTAALMDRDKAPFMRQPLVHHSQAHPQSWCSCSTKMRRHDLSDAS
jgi:hypothetical protein